MDVSCSGSRAAGWVVISMGIVSDPRPRPKLSSPGASTRSRPPQPWRVGGSAVRSWASSADSAHRRRIEVESCQLKHWSSSADHAKATRFLPGRATMGRRSMSGEFVSGGLRRSRLSNSGGICTSRPGSYSTRSDPDRSHRRRTPRSQPPSESRRQSPPSDGPNNCLMNVYKRIERAPCFSSKKIPSKVASRGFPLKRSSNGTCGTLFFFILTSNSLVAGFFRHWRLHSSVRSIKFDPSVSFVGSASHFQNFSTTNRPDSIRGTDVRIDRVACAPLNP